jgi:hypothetical protein
MRMKSKVSVIEVSLRLQNIDWYAFVTTVTQDRPVGCFRASVPQPHLFAYPIHFQDITFYLKNALGVHRNRIVRSQPSARALQ